MDVGSWAAAVIIGMIFLGLILVAAGGTISGLIVIGLAGLIIAAGFFLSTT